MSPESPKRDLTLQGIAKDLIAFPEFNLFAITGNGARHTYGTQDLLHDILLYGLVKLWFEYGESKAWKVNCPVDHARKILLLVRAEQQRLAKLDNIVPPVTAQVGISGPTRLRHHAAAFPLVKDLAAFGAQRLRRLPNVGNTTVRDAERYCEKHGLKLAP